MTKYKMGYSECVQECIRFVNNNTQIMPASPSSPVIGAQGMTGCLSPATAAALTGGASAATVIKKLLTFEKSENS